MPSPFPGMDPYLEDVAIWRGVHSRLINECSALLQPGLNERGYYVDIEEQVYLSEGERVAVADALVRESRSSSPRREAAVVLADEPVLLAERREEDSVPRLHIESMADRSLVTVIAILSPINKKAGAGRNQYLRKRNDLEFGGVALVEIDLLRQGPRVWDLAETRLAEFGPVAYLITITRGFHSELTGYPVRLTDRLPRIRIPLRVGETDAALDLQAAFDSVYDRGPYQMRIDYSVAPPPPRCPRNDLDWIDALLREKGKRS